jgi:hypothetical protein
MEMMIEVNLESRKTWVAPELKKVDVEAITAAGNLGATDGVLQGVS